METKTSRWFDDAGYLQLEIPADAVAACSHGGRCDNDVDHWLRELNFTVPRERAILWLKATGGWTRAELEACDDDELAAKVLWLACCDLRETGEWYGMVDC